MKKKKGVHFQLPGGHIDASEIERYGFRLAQMRAAARELYEETGIDVRDDCEERFQRLRFPSSVEAQLGPRSFFLMNINQYEMQ